MEQTERLRYLVGELLKESPMYRGLEIPSNETSLKRLFRSLVNIRQPGPADGTFLKIQDEYLREEIARKGITDVSFLTPVCGDLYLWQGDITTLKCGAVVNAANSGLLGCFYPCHGCIDNAIHTFAGIQLRQKCAEIMRGQKDAEPVGGAKITPAYNLPCEFVLHTVGPFIGHALTERDCVLLASCYRSCLVLAEKNGVRSIAFCCISTGEFRFPNDKAAEIAVNTVRDYKRETDSDIKVVFNVFKDCDREIYEKLLG